MTSVMDQVQAGRPNWQSLMESALNTPGILHECYSMFHRYSPGNQLLLMLQCMELGLPFGPAASYNRWKQIGSPVNQKGALSIVAPRFAKSKKTKEGGSQEESQYVYFVLVRGAFVYAQTVMNEVEFPPVPGWDADRAAENLGFERVQFESADGNTQGYSYPTKKQFAVNPVAAFPHKTAVHEFAHILLHGQDAEVEHTGNLPPTLKEVEAEAVALIVGESLEFGTADYSRGYIQNWWNKNEPLSDVTCRRVFSAANSILKAGRAQSEEEEEKV